MEPAPDVVAAYVQFLAALSGGDEAVVTQLATTAEAAALIGTAPDEWRAGADTWAILPAFVRAFWRAGLHVTPGNPRGYAAGALGWVVDRPTFNAPGDTTTQTRMTAIFQQENGAWQLVHLHHSVGVPDAEIAVFRRVSSVADASADGRAV